MSKIYSFKSIENSHDVYRGKACMKTFCKLSREHAMKIINFLKNEVIKQRAGNANANDRKMQKSVIFLKEKLKMNIWKIKNIVMLKFIVVIQRNMEVLCIAYVI